MYGLISFLLRISTYSVGIQGGLLQFVPHWDRFRVLAHQENSTLWKLSLTANADIYSARLEGGGMQSTVNRKGRPIFVFGTNEIFSTMRQRVFVFVRTVRECIGFSTEGRGLEESKMTEATTQIGCSRRTS